MHETKQLTLTGNESAEKLQRILGLNPELLTEELFLMLLKRPDVNGRYNCPISDILWKLIKINAFVPTQQAMEAARVCHFGKRGVEKHDQELGSVSDLFEYIIGGDKYPKQPWYMLWHLAKTDSEHIAKKFPKDHPLWKKLDEAINFELAKKSYRMLFDLIDDKKIHYTFTDSAFLAYAQDRIESHQHDRDPNPYYSKDNLLRDVLYLTSCGIRLSGSFVIWLCHFFGNYEKQETLKTPCYKILMQLLPATKHKRLDQELIQMGIEMGHWEAIVTLARDGKVTLDEATKKSIQAAILAYPHEATSEKLIDMRKRNLITFNAGIIGRKVLYLDTINNYHNVIEQDVLDQVKEVWPLLTAEEKAFSEKFIDSYFASKKSDDDDWDGYKHTHFSYWVLLLHNLIDITTASPKHKKMFCRWFWCFGISRYPQAAFDWYQKYGTHLTVQVSDILGLRSSYPSWYGEKEKSILNYKGPEQLSAGAWPYVYKITQDLTRQGRGISEEEVWKYLQGDNKQLWSLVVFMQLGLLPWFSPMRTQELQEMVLGMMHTLWKDKRIYNAKHTLVDQYHLPEKDIALHGIPHAPFLLAQQGLVDFLPPIILLEQCGAIPGFEAMYATQKKRINDDDLRRYLELSNDVSKILFFLSLTKQEKISTSLFIDLRKQVEDLKFEELLRLNVKNYPVLEHIVAQHGPLH